MRQAANYFITSDAARPAFAAAFFAGHAIEKNGAASKKNEDHYHYGYNGKMKDNEIAGVGNSLDYGARGYDPRIARFNSIDPLGAKFPELTPYQFASNKPIDGVDLDGLEHMWYMNVFAVEKWGMNKERETVSNAVLVTTSITMPIINQVHVICKEGFHMGSAIYPSSDLYWAVPYTLEDGWVFTSQEQMMENELNFDDGKKLMNATLDVLLAATELPSGLKANFAPTGNKVVNNLVNLAANKTVDALIKTPIKIGFANTLNLIGIYLGNGGNSDDKGGEGGGGGGGDGGGAGGGGGGGGNPNPGPKPVSDGNAWNPGGGGGGNGGGGGGNSK